MTVILTAHKSTGNQREQKLTELHVNGEPVNVSKSPYKNSKYTNLRTNQSDFIQTQAKLQVVVVVVCIVKVDKKSKR